LGYHVHHIKPKSTFEDKNDPQIHHPRNLIALHPDDHISIHKCRGDKQSMNFIRAIKPGYKHSSKTLLKMSKSLKGRISPCGMQNKRHTQESKDLISKNHRGRNTVASRIKISKTKQDAIWKRTVGVKTNEQISKTKLSAAWQLLNSTKCEYCKRVIRNKGMFKKYHGVNCKLNL